MKALSILKKVMNNFLTMVPQQLKIDHAINYVHICVLGKKKVNAYYQWKRFLSSG